MVLNYIWIAFFVVSFIFAVAQFLMGDTTIFQKIVDSTFDTSKTAFETSLGLTGVLALWLGIMRIGEKAGAVNLLARMLSPVFSRLFPDIPKNHPAMGSIFMNVASNMLGLDNAATPTGLKAMQQLQELNPKKDTATNPMIMFLVLNTSGLTIIPTTILAFRSSYGAAQPTDVFIPILLSTTVATLCGVTITCLFQRTNIMKPAMLAMFVGFCAFVGLIIAAFGYMDKDTMATVTSVGGNVILLSVIVAFIVGGLIKRINVYDAFIEGAKEGFQTAVRIIPYLVAILVAVSRLGRHGHGRRRHSVVRRQVRAQHRFRGRPAHGVHEAAVGKRSARNDARGHEDLRPRLVCGQAVVHLARFHRHHVLHPRGVFRIGEYQVHASCRGLRTSRRLGRHHSRYRHSLHLLRIINTFFSDLWQISNHS